MNLDKIIKCIEEGLPVDSSTLEEVQEIHKKFPFTSIFPMLILRGLKETKNVHFESELKKLSIQVNDRSVLEKLLTVVSNSEEHENTDIESVRVEQVDVEIGSSSIEQQVDEVSSKGEEKEDEVIGKKDESPGLQAEIDSPKLEIVRNEPKTVTDLSNKGSQEDEIVKSENKIPEPKVEVETPITLEPKDTINQTIEEEKSIQIEETTSEKENDESSDGLSPETLALIAEIKRKYGEEENESEEQLQKVKTESSNRLEQEENADFVEPDEQGTISDSTNRAEHEEKADFAEPKEQGANPDSSKRVEQLEKSEAEISDIEEDEEAIINFSLEDSIKSNSNKAKKKAQKKRKKKAKKEKKKLAERIKNQQLDSPFKFKEFKGEDSEYYHLEIDFSDLEPIEYSTEELDEKDEIDNFIEEPLKHKPKTKAKTIEPNKSEKIEEQLKNTVEGKEENNRSNFEEPVRIEVTSTSELTFLDWLKANKTKEKEIKKQDEIIDKFIADEPSLTKGKSEFFSPTKNAKKSLQDDMEIVSETLAELHVYQGSYSKAKKLYKKLILKNPEKKILFAKKLEEISELEKKK